MHMADALVSPSVGGTMWAVSAVVAAYSVHRLNREDNTAKIPLMGVMGAFIFAAQMINFSIPGTGSSGHLGGGLILASILGPYAAFLVMASVLLVQCLFFADGGLLAYGCNLFNMGFLSCMVAYPFLFKPLAGGNPATWTKGRITLASIVAAVIGLQLGAFGVVVETEASGVTALPFGQFALLMQPIHLAIGVVEGLATAAVILFVRNMQPGVFQPSLKTRSSRPGKLVIVLALIAALIGGVFSWYAASDPDGLEWAMAKTFMMEELPAPETDTHHRMAVIQEETAFLPDYSFASGSTESTPAMERAGTSLSGLLGAGIVFVLIVLGGWATSRFRHGKSSV